MPRYIIKILIGLNVSKAEFKERDPSAVTQNKKSTMEKMKARKKLHQLQR